MKRGLSGRQREVLEVVQHWTHEHGQAPTVRELAQRLGVSSTATIHQHLTALESKGYLARRRYRHRALEAQLPPRRPPASRPSDLAQVPLLGSIVAGRPLEAIEVLDAWSMCPRRICLRASTSRCACTASR
jgi:repressor LexA